MGSINKQMADTTQEATTNIAKVETGIRMEGRRMVLMLAKK